MNNNQIYLRDMQWARQIRNDNKNSFDLLYKEYFETIYKYYKNQYLDFNEEFMKDIVQDIFIRIWENRKNWKPKKNVKAYLYRSVYFQIISESRKKHFNKQYKFNQEINPIDNVSSPLEILQIKELNNNIQIKINKLPKRCKEIVIRRFYHGLSYSAISDEMDISENTIKTQIRRAKKALRCKLESDYYDTVLTD